MGREVRDRAPPHTCKRYSCTVVVLPFGCNQARAPLILCPSGFLSASAPDLMQPSTDPLIWRPSGFFLGVSKCDAPVWRSQARAPGIERPSISSSVRGNSLSEALHLSFIGTRDQ